MHIQHIRNSSNLRAHYLKSIFSLQRSKQLKNHPAHTQPHVKPNPPLTCWAATAASRRAPSSTWAASVRPAPGCCSAVVHAGWDRTTRAPSVPSTAPSAGSCAGSSGSCLEDLPARDGREREKTKKDISASAPSDTVTCLGHNEKGVSRRGRPQGRKSL